MFSKQHRQKEVGKVRNKTKVAKSHRRLRQIWGAVKFVLIFLALILFFVALWRRAGIELLVDSNVSKASQQFLFWKLIIEYVTSPEVVLGLASFLLALNANSFERRQKEQEQNENARDQLQKMPSLPVLEQLRKYLELEERSIGESWSDGPVEDLQQIQNSFSEGNFFQAVSECLRQGKQNELIDIEKLYNRFFENHEDFDKHKNSVSVLAKIITQQLSNHDSLSIVSDIVKLWDDFDADVKDLIVLALNQFPGKASLSQLPKDKLENQVFNTANRRRLLRTEELNRLFPQLDTPLSGYDVAWRHLPRCKDDSRIAEWLKQHDLVANPFGCSDLTVYPFYPKGAVRPDRWEYFLEPVPGLAQCPTAEDASSLAYLLRQECLPFRENKDDVIEAGWYIFPILVNLDQEFSVQSPLITLAHTVTRSWLDILPLSPDALLDLLPAEQDAVLELLCWSIGAKSTALNLIRRSRFGENSASRLLERKITDFTNHFSPEYPPQDHVLLSWLTVRPPSLNHSYLILLHNDSQQLAHPLWLEKFSPLISSLFLNGIVTKVFSSTSVPSSLVLPAIELLWSDTRLKQSLNSQFGAAMDDEAKQLGHSIHFYELFGLGATEEEMTEKLISVSHNSLARMLMLGNRLLQKHCEKEMPEKYLSLEELEDILKAA